MLLAAVTDFTQHGTDGGDPAITVGERWFFFFFFKYTIDLHQGLVGKCGIDAKYANLAGVSLLLV